MSPVTVLVIEDEEEKLEEISGEIRAFFKNVEIETSRTFGDATQKLLQEKYDLVVVDLLLPRRGGEDPVDISEEIIDHLSESDLNKLTTTVAISRFEEVVDRRRDEFVKAGILLIAYCEDDAWRACLRVCMQRVSLKTLYDFVIICALGMERTAFEGVDRSDFEIGPLQSVLSMDVREMTLGKLRGICVLQPQMGLVDASITATKALDAFTPRLICMSGICAGFEGRVELGTLVVSDYTWEHQAGKHLNDKFEIRSYQESLENSTRIALSQMLEEDPRLAALASKAHQIAVPSEEAKLGPSVSGSAVIASSKYADHLKQQHGKVAAVDMEVFGVYRAAALSGRPVICFAAKTVVDHANEAKGDSIQQAGAILSARFVVKAVERLLSA
jgi:nucleoside phosphorylase